VDPRQAAIGARQVIQLGLLSDPEDPQCQEAHHVHDEPWRQRHKARQSAFAVHASAAGARRSRTSNVIATAKMPSLNAAAVPRFARRSGYRTLSRSHTSLSGYP